MSITSVSQPHDGLNPAGGDTVVVFGHGFFTVVNESDFVGTATLQNSVSSVGIDCVVTTEDTEMNCTVGAGAGAGFVLTLTVEGEVAVFGPMRYLAPVVSSAAVQSSDGAMSTAGGDTIIIVGTNFGPPGSGAAVVATLTPDAALCAVCPFVILHSCTVADSQHVSCVSSVGVGAPLSLNVSVGGQNATMNGVVSLRYRKPTVTLVRSGSGGSGVSTLVGGLVTIIGSDLGTAPTVSFSLDGTVISLSGCANTSVDTSHVTCTAPTTWVGVVSQWSVVVGNQAVNVSDNGTFAVFAVPSVTSVVKTNADTLGTLLKTAGGEQVTITGTSFGATTAVVAASYGPVIPSVSYRFVALNCSLQAQDTAITCTTAPGSGAGHTWAVSINGVAAACGGQCTTSYPNPVVGVVSLRAGGGTQMDTNGGQLVSITGSNFGPASVPVLVTAAYTNSAGVT